MRPIAQRGFTLIELMITVVIIAILASIAVPSYQNYIKKSKLQEAQSNLVGLSLSVENTYQRQLSYPSTSTTGTLTYTATNPSSSNLKNTFSTWSPTSKNFDYSYESLPTTTDSKGNIVAYKITATSTNSILPNGCKVYLYNNAKELDQACGFGTNWIQ